MIVEDERQHLPSLVLRNSLFDFPTSDLFVESVEKLLTSRGSRECRAVMQSSAEPTEVEQAFFRSRERDAHAIEEIDDPGRHVGHPLDGRLIREKIASVNGVVKVFSGRVALALGIHRAVDAALRAH
jgi:hypothetical protein